MRVRLVGLVQVKCEKEDQASSLEPLSFTKELKINDIDFVQDFQRYEGYSAVFTTSNALDHDPFSGLLLPPRPRMSPALDPSHFRHYVISNTSHRLPGWSRCCPWSGRASVRTAPVSPPSTPM
jgi:hypothetical protein